jgi:hypothetical protein
MAKVVRFHELGGPEVLRLEEITFEDPAPGELRFKVGRNRLEVVYRSGGFPQGDQLSTATPPPLAGRTVLLTDATRSIGAGIALTRREEMPRLLTIERSVLRNAYLASA